MKSTYLSLGGLFLILQFSFGCAKEKQPIVNSIDEEKISEVKKIAKDKGNGILAYRLLSSSEKSFLWSERLKGFLNKSDFTERQISLIEKTIDLISPELFASPAKTNFSESIKKLEYDVLQNFTPDQVVTLFASISDESPDQGINLSIGAPCTCRWSTVCQLMNEHAICEWGWASCQETEDGCGFLFLYACKGKCVIYNPPA